MARYNVSEQEGYYNPVRIKVAKARYSRRREGWVVFQFNTKNYDKEKVFTNDGWVKPRDWASDIFSTRKAEAISTAKKQAQALKLAFDPDLDVADDIKTALQLRNICDVCGEHSHISVPPNKVNICIRCEGLMDKALLIDERGTFLEVAAGKDNEIVQLIVQVAGSSITDIYVSHEYTLGVHTHSSKNEVGRAILKKAQFKAAKELYELIYDMKHEAYRNGQKHGQNLLRQMAAGELSIEQVNATREE